MAGTVKELKSKITLRLIMYLLYLITLLDFLAIELIAILEYNLTFWQKYWLGVLIIENICLIVLPVLNKIIELMINI